MRTAALAAAGWLALVTASFSAYARGPADAYHGRGSENVFWFVHVSDLHIGTSTVEDPKQNASPHLEQALGAIVPAIKPAFVIASGDLTDGSWGVVPTIGGQQDEWDSYRDILTTAGMKLDFYFDLPGNHDAYGESNGLSYYLKNSLQGPENGVPYVSWSVQIPDGEMLFFGLNSAGDGAAQMTNPPGTFTDDELDYVEQTLDAHPQAELVVMAGHHPLDGAVNVDRVYGAYTSAKGGYYLHGHRHDYTQYLDGNVVVNEVGSLGKGDTSNIGLVAIDHNALVYRATDVVDPFPFVMITAPVAAALRSGEPHPYAYKVCRSRKDNPVRALVYGDALPSSVTAQAGAGPAAALKPVAAGSPLYEGELDTSSLQAGLHDIAVVARFGTAEASDVVTAEFVDGPCEPLPVDPGMGGEAGGGGAGPDAGQDGAAGAAGAAGKAGAAGGSGAAGAAGNGLGGSAGSPAQAEQVDQGQQEQGGCACSAAGRPVGTLSRLGGGLLALAALLRRRR